MDFDFPTQGDYNSANTDKLEKRVAELERRLSESRFREIERRLSELSAWVDHLKKKLR